MRWMALIKTEVSYWGREVFHDKHVSLLFISSSQEIKRKQKREQHFGKLNWTSEVELYLAKIVGKHTDNKTAAAFHSRSGFKTGAAAVQLRCKVMAVRRRDASATVGGCRWAAIRLRWSLASRLSHVGWRRASRRIQTGHKFELLGWRR